MQKTLLISYTLPPSHTGTATVINNLMREFGREEMLVVGAKMSGMQFESSESHLPQVKYILWRVPAFRGAAVFVWLQMPLALVLACYHYLRAGCTRVVAIYPTHHFLAVGLMVARIMRAPFFPYFHNTMLENVPRNRVTRSLFGLLQNAIFKQATKIFVISDGLRKQHETSHPLQEFVTIPHSFSESVGAQKIKLAEEAKSFALVGSINASNRDSTIRLLTTLNEIAETQVFLSSATPYALLHECGVDKLCAQMPTMTRADLFLHLRAVDAVLLPHGFTGKLSEVEYQTIFPTKTLEYLICGRPIVAHCKKGTFLHDFLEVRECAFIIDSTDREVIKDQLQLFTKDRGLRERIVRNALAASKEFQGGRVAKLMRRNLETLQTNGMEFAS